MNDLLPCPFCGGEAALDEHPPHTHSLAKFMPDHPGSFTIECRCGAAFIDKTKSAVIAAWNRRTPDEKEIKG